MVEEKSIESLFEIVVEVVKSLIENRKVFSLIYERLNINVDYSLNNISLLSSNGEKAVESISVMLEDSIEIVFNDKPVLSADAFTILKDLTWQARVHYCITEKEFISLIEYVVDSSYEALFGIPPNSESRKKFDESKNSVKHLIKINPWLFTLIIMELIPPAKTE